MPSAAPTGRGPDWWEGGRRKQDRSLPSQMQAWRINPWAPSWVLPRGRTGVPGLGAKSVSPLCGGCAKRASQAGPGQRRAASPGWAPRAWGEAVFCHPLLWQALVYRSYQGLGVSPAGSLGPRHLLCGQFPPTGSHPGFPDGLGSCCHPRLPPRLSQSLRSLLPRDCPPALRQSLSPRPGQAPRSLRAEWH